jgi:hypothetical protein
MRLMKIALRFWIGLTSVFSFLGGWVLLAHSPKPVSSSPAPAAGQAAAIDPLPTLAPLPPLKLPNGSTSSGETIPQFNIRQRAQAFSQVPLFTTGGS